VIRFILDTDHLSILQKQQQPEYDRLKTRLEKVPDDTVGTTIVNFQEQVLGWMSYNKRARTAAAVLKAYRELLMVEAYFRDYELLPFEAAAQTWFEDLRQRKVRIPTMDLRIACIALVRNATLLTRNVRDFRQVPGLTFEDWAR
jgi:tRNA(fMet)-specific endonuclease VapC